VLEAHDLLERCNAVALPLIDERRLIGLVSHSDLAFEEPLTPLSQLLRTSSKIAMPDSLSAVELREYFLKWGIQELALVDTAQQPAGFAPVGELTRTLGYPDALLDEGGRLLAGAAVGVAPDLLTRARALVEAGADLLVLDSAHGHSLAVVRAVALLKQTFPTVPILAGNIVTPEAVRDLVIAGADAVKVGIGPGSICTTRYHCWSWNATTNSHL